MSNPAPTITLCLPYYRNPGMLSEHYRQWAAWPDEVKDRVEVVVVDDGSPAEHAIDVPRPEGLPALRIYRFPKDLRWGWPQARNLAAKKAQGEWLVLTDMDHAIEPEVLGKILAKPPRKDRLWTFHRVDVSDDGLKFEPRKVHFNSFLCTRALFSKIGGYDEVFGELYSGKDGEFRRRAQRLCQIVLLPDGWRLVRYHRHVIADASTRNCTRKDPADKKLAHALIRRLEADPQRKILTLVNKWERQL